MRKNTNFNGTTADQLWIFRLFERKPGKSVDQSECVIDKSTISQEKNLATLNTDLQLVGYVPWLMRVVSEKWCKRAHKLTKKIFWHIFYILWFGSEFSDKRKGFHFFNFRKNAAAGKITLTGMAQRNLVGKTMFQTVAARRKRRTVDKALQIFTKLYVKLFSCINLYDF